MKKFLLAVLFFVFAKGIALADPQLIQGEEDPIFIITLGDSAAKGVWADSSLGSPGAGFYWSAFLSSVESVLLKRIFGYDHTYSPLQGARDHIQDIEKLFGHVARESLSGIAGNQDYSLPVRIEEHTGRKTKVLNASFLAASFTTSTLAIEKIDQFYKKNPYHIKPQAVFISYNGMDFMFEETLPNFQASVKNLLSETSSRFPDTHIVVTELVDMVGILTNQDQLAIPSGVLLEAHYCSDVYDRIGFGKRHGLSPGQTGQNVQMHRRKVQKMNQILAKEISDFKQAGLANGNPKKIDLVSTVAHADWAPYLAADCLHPNKNGQKLISDEIWKKVSAINLFGN
ncbi:MAG: SGNH/GDSL hydrolase family protein [Oligoflexales bacterium]